MKILRLRQGKRVKGEKGGVFWYEIGNSKNRLNKAKMRKALVDGYEIEFTNGKNVNELLSIIFPVETSQLLNDVGLMNRIIKNGGAVKYIEELEMKIKWGK